MIPVEDPELWEPALACRRCTSVVGVSRIAEHEAAHSKWDEIDAAQARFAEHDGEAK